jgi:hypothetical protein
MTFIFPRGHISGLTFSTAGASTTFNVTAGQAADTNNAVIMNFAAAMNKTTAAWSVGSGGGAFGDVGSIAANTWYHAFLIGSNPDNGVIDVIVSANPITPTYPTGYSISRRIFSLKTNGSSQWAKAIQLGEEFLWESSVLDVNSITVTGLTSTLLTLSVPSGIQVIARFDLAIVNASNVGALVNSPDQSFVSSPTFPNMNITNGTTSGNMAAEYQVRTNTSSQIRIQTPVTTSGISITTQGWTDTRGRFA